MRFRCEGKDWERSQVGQVGQVLETCKCQHKEEEEEGNLSIRGTLVEWLLLARHYTWVISFHQPEVLLLLFEVNK